MLHLKFKQYYFGGTLNAGNYDETTVTYNFTDQPTSTTRKHYLASVLKVTIAGTNIYDHQGRKIKAWQQLTNADGTTDLAPDTRTLLAKLDYNEIGQLRADNQHSTDSVAYLQTLNNTYKERGWLSKISTKTNKLMVDLRYNDADAGIAPQFNGNIAQQLYSGQYSLKDHLGNVRVTVDKDPTAGTARVVQEDEYYAFGLRVNKYDFSVT